MKAFSAVADIQRAGSSSLLFRVSAFKLDGHLPLLGKLRLVLLKESGDTLVGLEQLADGVVVVEGINNVGNVFAHIDLNVPGLLADLGLTVYQVRGEDLVNDPLFVTSCE